jgi:hypothetical protein
VKLKGGRKSEKEMSELKRENEKIKNSIANGIGEPNLR